MRVRYEDEFTHAREAIQNPNAADSSMQKADLLLSSLSSLELSDTKVYEP